MPLDSRHTQGFGAPVPLRTAEQTRELQLKVASLIVSDTLPDAWQEAHLRELLLMLDLMKPTADAPRRVAVASACAEDVGTLRGYRRHVAAYSTPCNPCLNARREELDERWRTLGIDRTDIVVLT